MLRELEDREIWGEDPETYTEWSDLLSMGGIARRLIVMSGERAGRQQHLNLPARALELKAGPECCGRDRETELTFPD